MIRNGVITRFLLIGAGAATILPSGAAPAQSAAGTVAAPSTPAEVDAADAIVVTGSRIARPALESAVPVAIVGADEIHREGATNIQSVIARLPQAGIPGFTSTNSNFLVTGNGVSTINLRNLGDARTLVLVNGRRFVAGVAGTSIVDVNNIPADFVDRVEVVTGGASSVYGSDAIAGVVNFVLKDRYKGLTARAQYGISSYGDNRKIDASITGGFDFGPDGRGSILGNVTYDRDYGLLASARPISSQDCSQLGCGPQSYSTFAPQGYFQLYRGGAPTGNAGFASNLFTFNPDNSVVTGFPASYGYNRQAVRRISTPVERSIGNLIGHYDLTDGVKAFVEGTYSHVKSSAAIEPLGLFSDQNLGFGYGIDNPFIPPAIAAQIAARNGDADPTNNVDQISFRRRQTEVFSRSNRNTRDTFRIAAGLSGEIASRWKWEASYTYGQLKDHTRTQDLDLGKYKLALDAIRDPATNQIVCRNVAARAAGCVPINLFGYNTVTPAAAAYVASAVPREEHLKNSEQVANANISGPLFALPAGDVMASLGGEYRREKSRDDWDALTNAGLNTGNRIPDTIGTFDVKEVFGELQVPLLKDKSLVNSLSVQGAARYSDYSTVGSVFSWNAGGEWSPVAGLRFRGNYAIANRAPNIAELYQPASETFASLNDPCNGVTATTGNATYAAACRATPAVAAGIARNGGIIYTAADSQGINGFTGGNPNLKEERGRTITLGTVIAPVQVRGLSLTVDYFDIRIRNAIGTVDRLTSVQQCLLTGLSQFCDNVIRNPQTGLIRTVNATNINISSIKTRGLDTDLRYSRALGLFADDRIDFNAMWSHAFRYLRKPDPSAPVQNGVGNLQYGKVFRDKVTGRASYTAGPFSGSWATTYLSRMTAYSPANQTVASLLALGYDPSVASHNVIKAYVYHDIQLRARVGPRQRLELFVGVDNLFNRKPPKLEDAPAYPTGVMILGTETAADVYDPFGRRLYAGAQISF